MTRTVLISGASIAGPTLAFWLQRSGFEPTVVERSATVRGGSYPIDVRAAAIEVADRMGLLPALRDADIDTRQATVVDARGRPIARIAPKEFTGRPGGVDVELPRGTLARLLYDRTRDDVEYRFADSITALDPQPDGVHVTFRNAAPQVFDLVVGADGLHSTVRALTFGPETDYRHDLGFAFAGFGLDPAAGAWGPLESELLMHNTPGRMAGIYAVRGQPVPLGVLAFATPPGFAFDPADRDQQCELLAAAFAEGGWEVPRLVASMRTAEDRFFDTVSQIRMPRWTTDRVALVGDAAHAPALLSGQGTSLAMIGAYTLAVELTAAGGDPARAFAGYERRLRPFVGRNQDLVGTGAAALIPRSRTALWLRNRVLAALPHLGPAKRLFNNRIDRAATSFPLPDPVPPPELPRGDVGAGRG